MLNLITCSEESPPLPNLPITVVQYLKTRQFRLVDTSRGHALRTKESKLSVRMLDIRSSELKKMEGDRPMPNSCHWCFTEQPTSWRNEQPWARAAAWWGRRRRSSHRRTWGLLPSRGDRRRRFRPRCDPLPRPRPLFGHTGLSVRDQITYKPYRIF